MRFLLAVLMLLSFAAACLSQTQSSRASVPSGAEAASLKGRWQVKFTVSGNEQHLTFTATNDGNGSFLLLDTGPDNQPVTKPVPAIWSLLSNKRVSFSGEAELPLGTCCRETGTMIFKGKFSSDDSLAGTMIFVTSVEEEESAYKFHSAVGTFSATRVK
jgi:hypothetical protein